MPQKSWAVGEEVLAADFNTYVQDQTVAVFASTASRDSEWPSPPNGATCVVTANNAFYQRINGIWYTPFQRLAYIAVAGNQGPTGGAGENVLAGLILPAVTLPSARLVRVETGFRAATGTAGEGATLRIREGTSTAGTQILDLVINFAPSGVQAGSAAGNMIGRTYAPSAGSRQWCATLQGAANPATLLGLATSPLWIEVRDVGPG
jgi:hypothetical protein